MRSTRLPVLDGMRGVAVAMVVLLHNWSLSWFSMPELVAPLVRGGFIGVLLFFFLSGFVLALPYVQASISSAPIPSWRHFVNRRYMKIIPSYLLCILILQLCRYQGSSTRSLVAVSSLRDVVTHLLFIHNFSYDTIGTLNGVMWSLAPEVQFYAMFPLLVLAFVRLPLITTGALFLIANVWRMWAFAVHDGNLALEMHQLPCFLDMFGAGMFSAYMCAVPGKRCSAIYSALMVAGIGAFLWLMSDLLSTSGQPDWHDRWDVTHNSALAVAFSVTTIGAIYAWRPMQFVLANPPLIFLGAISYNLYLWHEVIAYVLIWHHIPPYPSGIDNPEMSDLPQWRAAFTPISVACSIAVATFVTYAFERPLLKLLWRSA